MLLSRETRSPVKSCSKCCKSQPRKNIPKPDSTAV